MSVQIKIDNAVKKYGNNVIIPSLNLTIKESCKQKSIAEMKKVPQNLHS